MKRILCLPFILLMAFGSFLYAQEKTVTGTVTADEDGSALPGVNVLVEGTSQGTITDMNGQYSISVPEAGATLTFSYIGYLAESVEVGSQTVVDVTMTPDIVGLEEVVVTALGITKEKKTLGYAVTDVGGEELTTARDNNVINSLSGKVAGLTTNVNSGGPAGSNRVTLRGNASLTSTNEVLYVIDGIPMDNTSNENGADEWGNGFDLGNGVVDLNPDDIESVSVLKGPNAAALYGSRAQNGVIVITTKKGTSKGLGVSFSTNYQIEQAAYFPQLQNEYGQGQFGAFPADIDALSSLSNWGPKMDGTMQPYWDGTTKPYSAQSSNVEDFFQNGHTWTNSLALDGASETSSFRISYTNVDYKGIVPNNALKRNSFTLRGTQKFGDKLSADSKITYSNQTVENRPFLSGWGDNVMLNLLSMGRNTSDADIQNYTYEDGSVRMPFTGGANNNPYHTVNEVTTDDTRNRVLGFGSLTYEFTDWLKAMARAGIDYSVQDFLFYAPSNHPFIGGGRVNDRTFTNKESNYDFLVMINKPINEQFDFSLNLGGNIMIQEGKFGGYQGDGLTVDGIKSIGNTASNAPIAGAGKSEKRVHSLYASGQFGFNNYLFLDWSARNDWSSALPSDNRSYFYPSVSLSALVSDMVDLPVIDFWKIRGSYAIVGNDVIPYQTSVGLSTQLPYLGRPVLTPNIRLQNADLKPEETTSIEVGTDIRFIQNRVSIDFTYYNQSTVDQIVFLPLAQSSGYREKVINSGEVKNSGIELLVSGKILQSSDLKWDLSVNFAKNKSEIVDVASDLGIDFLPLGQIQGNIPFSMRATKGGSYGEIWGAGYARDPQGNKIIDGTTGTPVPTDEMILLGDINPDFTAGISSTLSYKGVSFSFLINGNFGGERLSITDALMDQNGVSENSLVGREGMVLDGVVNTGTDEAPVYAPNDTEITAEELYSTGGNTLLNNGILEDYVIDATYIKMQEMSLSYDLPKSLLESTPLQSATVSFVGRNLFFLSKKADNFDPSVSGYTSGNTTGVEWYSLPSTRTFGFNLSVKF